jgi:AI-2 transport protein TqsA
MSNDHAFTSPERTLLTAAALVIVIAGVHAAQSVVGPFLLAVFIAVVATPLLRWLQRFGWPTWAGVLLVSFVILDVGGLLVLLGSGAIEGFRDSLPGYQERLGLLIAQFADWLEGLGLEGSREAVPDLFSPAEVIGLTRAVLAGLSGIAAEGLLILLTVVFILLEAPTLPAKLKVALNTTAHADARFQQLFSSINRYMVIKAATSLGTAALVVALLTHLGIDFAVLWAILAFFLNFVPFVGSVLMAIPALLVALVQTDLQTTLLVALGYLVINIGVGSYLEPRIMGRGLGISTLAVFLALLFWGLVLGTVGVFLAVPLTMAMKIALESSPHTRPIAVMLGPEIGETRDLAGGVDSATADAPAQQHEHFPRQDRKAPQQRE